MKITGSFRAQELRADLAQRFGLDEEVVSQGLVALVSSIRGRLPRPVWISLASWVPEAWSVVGGHAGASGLIAARGAEAIKQRVAEAGVPYDVAGPFVVEVVRHLANRCGSPLATALHSRVPEFSLIEQEIESSLA
jgi:hypothetical protein